jgi:glycosyltransferase involved in cell wall biosynthesis
MPKIPVSVEILSRNSARTLPRALESVSAFSEILLIDGDSTDDTRHLAEASGARVFRQEYKYLHRDGRIADFAGVRNQGLEAAQEQWFLFLDSDEYLSQELVEAIKKAVEGPPAAYWVYRKYELSGETIDCASTYPNKNMRLFHKDAVVRFIKPVHERVLLKETAVVKELPQNAALMVPLIPTPEEWRIKNRRYIQAELSSQNSITVVEWVRRCWHRFLVSGLYALRTIRNFACTGKRMPLPYELNRHWYHFVLSLEELRLIRKRPLP